MKKCIKIPDTKLIVNKSILKYFNKLWYKNNIKYMSRVLKLPIKVQISFNGWRKRQSLNFSSH